MNLVTRTAEKIFRAAGAVESVARAPRVRGFDAAKHSRLNADFPATTLSADQELRYTAKTMRGRSRFVAQNNDYFVGYRHKLEVNVVGPHGIVPKVSIKKKDGTKKEDLNRKVEDAWREWCRPENCDVEGQLSFRDFQALAVKTRATDGEFLIRKVNDGGSFRLQFLDVDWLDEDFNDPKLANGNRVVMSVEKTRFGKVVAYWFTEPKYAGFDATGLKLVPKFTDRLRVPAEQIIHGFLKERPGQTRGYPITHSAMMTLNQLDGFDEAELVGARIGAANMAFVSAPAEADGGDASDTPIDTEVNPGQVLELPPGYTVHEFTPTKPLDTGFSKRMLRKIAGSLGINYNSLTPDLEGVNFSSIRAGEVSERDGWRVQQEWLATHLCQPVFESWLMFQSGLVPATQLEQVMHPEWMGRGFDWVDPAKDIKADIDAVNMGLKTRTEVLADRGKDFEETMEQIAYENEKIESLGLEFSSDGKPAEEETDEETGKPKTAAAGSKK